MSEQTATTTQSPSGFFGTSAFGAIKVNPVTTKVTTPIPPEIAADFARAVTYFSAHTNRHVLDLDLPDEDAAKTLRGQIQQYADEHNLTAGFPKHVAAHVSKDKTDPKTGKVTPGKPVEDNGLPAHWNVGANVTFRFAAKRENKNGPVTTTTTSAAQ